MIRNLSGWIIVIGQLENLTNKFTNELSQRKPKKEQFIDLLILVSSKFENVRYNYNNAKRYSYFEHFITENGKLA
jgi:hypothetical protein